MSKGQQPNSMPWADIGLVAFVFSVLLWMVLPLRPWMLDLLLAVSISSGLLVMLVIIYVREPSEFTAFPTLLLIITLFRLGINVASTRLILGEAQAGQIIQKFGEVVVQNNYVVGFVVFIILTLINFVVITKGAGRIAEVAARFTLDAMPGKQMAIDAELNAGLIKEDQARTRREELAKETDFYGSMDGASKFVRGDAIAGIIITLVNVVGGIGIMNIMLATVTERTREIGIRRALGATKGEIVQQFLWETVVLSGTGGLLGVAVGFLCGPTVQGVRLAIESFLPDVWSTLPPTIHQLEPRLAPWSIIAAFGISVGVGIVFGIFRAQRAANMDPIEALRHE